MSESGVLPSKIVKYPDPRLRKKCASVEHFGPQLEDLGRHMLEMMKQHNGVGLAGPQIGVMERIFVCNASGKPEDDRIYVNPQLEDLTGGEEAEEGCLSIPDVRVVVRRARQCVLKARDPQGNPVELRGQDLEARIWQHEIDHLDGRLIIDRMSAADKIANKKRLAELEAEYRK